MRKVTYQEYLIACLAAEASQEDIEHIMASTFDNGEATLIAYQKADDIRELYHHVCEYCGDHIHENDSLRVYDQFDNPCIICDADECHENHELQCKETGE